jgi:isoquinoline 1-oxidoreductase subunit beta
VAEGKAVLLDAQIAAQSASQQFMQRLTGRSIGGPDKGHVDAAFNAPYAIPNHRVRGYLADLAVPVGLWRSVGASFNGFFTESFVDELAVAAGADPLQFRIDMARAEWEPAAQVLEAVRDMSGWTGETPEGIGRGVAMVYAFGTPVAMVIEVRDTGAGIAMTDCWIACDPGTALDPGIIEAQMTGGAVYGLSAAIGEEITFAEGAVEQSNYSDYPVLRMHTCQRFHVRILENQRHIGGVGEPGTPPAAPALANALFDLTGVAGRQLPLIRDFDLIV